MDPAAYRVWRLAVAFGVCGVVLLLVALAAVAAIIRDDDPTLSGFGVVNLVVIVLVLIGAILGAIVVMAIALSGGSARTRWRALAVIGGVVFGVPALPMLLLLLLEVGISWRGALLSIPTTTFALWTFRRMQRNRKPPWWLVLAAFGWGSVVSSYFAQIVEGLLHAVIRADVPPGTAAIVGHAAAAAFPEEFVKAAGVVFLVLLAWRRIDGMLSGLVLGACVGLGFQFAESMSYMTQGFDSVLYQHWYRQVTGLLVSHATYAGIIGAGVGLATQLKDWPRRIVVATGGLLFAIAAHLVWDICAMGHFSWESSDANIQLFVAQPATLIALKGPAFLVLLALVVVALRQETRSLHRQLRAEAANRLGAVSSEEVSLLLDASGRFRLRLRTLRDGGYAAYQRIKQLHTAQLELAFTRWRRERGESTPPGAEEALRQRIYRLKASAPA
ncbi:MAG: PrsW family intramembrane metalloprotease [Hamadaea sp.]|nr:PrsW family intramembrane metalloprotease [Hamadaea sp.]NUR52660.1 PrsW family intramembrane metalloprotease [Hamadaea sp.]NUT02568.1 PrsW family intramembrane metalloprotease [Hamadaea sp.]